MYQKLRQKQEVTGKEITEEEFDAEIESTENQETVDPEIRY